MEGREADASRSIEVSNDEIHTDFREFIRRQTMAQELLDRTAVFDQEI